MSINLKSIAVVMMCFFGFQGLAVGEEIKKEGLTIAYVSAIGNLPTNYTRLSDKVLVGFNDVSWLPTHCHADGVYVDSNMNAVLSVALKAFELNKPVQVRIDSSQTKDGYCGLILLSMGNVL